MDRTGMHKGTAVTIIAVSLLVLFASGASATQQLSFANGISVRLHEPDEILTEGGVLADAAGGPYALREDTDAWYPLATEQVLAALADMRGFTTDVSVEVYILPAPPVTGGRSWSTRDAIFLVPGFGRVAPETVAYITTHEIGHVLTWTCLDAYPDRWNGFLKMRGLDLDKFQTGGEHAWLPREILAEDIRFLFGGYLATTSGSIENHELVTPDRVKGLRELLAGYLGDRSAAPQLAMSSAYPNPCNPRTTIRMTLPRGASGDARAELRIYDLRGGLVQRLAGGQTGPGVVEIPWDGKDQLGGTVASGRYLYVMKAAGLTARGAVTLVR